MKITVIAAMAKNRVIGKNNDLPWRLPSDLAHFKRTTLGKPMLMGRKTFDSFGGRPLPKRHHIILSSRPEVSTENVTWSPTIDDALAYASEMSNHLFVIGGAKVFEQLLPKAHQLILTELADDYEGDTFFPVFDRNDWKLAQEVIPHEQELPYVIRYYTRLPYGGL